MVCPNRVVRKGWTRKEALSWKSASKTTVITVSNFVFCVDLGSLPFLTEWGGPYWNISGLFSFLIPFGCKDAFPAFCVGQIIAVLSWGRTLASFSLRHTSSLDQFKTVFLGAEIQNALNHFLVGGHHNHVTTDRNRICQTLFNGGLV